MTNETNSQEADGRTTFSETHGEAKMRVYSETIKLKTKSRLELIDITDDVNRIFKQSNIDAGFVNVFSKHTTLAIKINESESLLFRDIKNLLDEIFPPEKDYFHDKIELREGCPINEPKNADGHLKCLFLESSQIIPIKNCQLCLGKWQKVIVIETSGPREREIEVQVIGLGERKKTK